MAVEAMVAEDSLAATGADRAATGVEEAAAAEVAGPGASERTRKSSQTNHQKNVKQFFC